MPGAFPSSDIRSCIKQLWLLASWISLSSAGFCQIANLWQDSKSVWVMLDTEWMLSTIIISFYHLEFIMTTRFFLLHLFYVRVVPGQHYKTDRVSGILWHTFLWPLSIYSTAALRVLELLLLASMAAENFLFYPSPWLALPEMTHVAALYLPISFTLKIFIFWINCI